MIHRECFVIQRCGPDGKHTDWLHPLTRRADYDTHPPPEQAARVVLARKDAITLRIVRRVWTYVDFAV